ncbi:MAG: methyl-accepting chemotaxis protein [Negativicutes bacterium]|nr:methyl-accepting chemotaxis protein [Negativicutes bacterium]
MKIRTKLVVIMVLLSFIPLVTLSFISIRYLSTTLEEETINQCRELTGELQLQIDGFLDRPLTTIRVIATNPAARAVDVPQVKGVLVEAFKAYPDIAFCFDDATGYMVARGDNLSLFNLADRAYVQSALKGNEDVISEVIVSKNTNQPAIVMATPVRSADQGAIVGVMQGTIELTKISEFVKNLSANGTVGYVIDSGGKILAHPDTKLVQDRTDMSAVSFVKTGLAEKKNGYAVIEDPSAGKKLVSYAYQARTGWLICLEEPYTVITAKTRSLSIILGAVTLVVLAIVGGLVLLVARRFSDPILKMQNMASQIAQGDLTRKIELASNDEIGLLAKAFDTMVTNLKQLIGQVQGNAHRVAASAEQLTASAGQSAQAANQVAASITEVAQGADEQSHVVQEASVIARQMSESIRQVASNATAVSEQSTKTAETAKEGGKSVECAVQQMLGLEQTVSASARVVARLGERSKEIGQIVDTISGIAGQTNLLALNAAIEAARAGEQGRGFAVVAEEVRKLAEQSQEAAKQIAHLIGEIRGETDQAVSAMDAGTREVNAGTGVVNEAGKAFREIIALVTDLADRVEEISTAIRQLASGSQQIVSSVQQIDQLTKKATGEAQTVSAATEEQSASMQEIASASQNLASLAQDLQMAISKFQV